MNVFYVFLNEVKMQVVAVALLPALFKMGDHQ